MDCSSDEYVGRLIVSEFKRSRIKCDIQSIHHGPSVTLFELSVDTGKRISSIQSLSDRLVMALEVENVRMMVPVPGKNTIGVEVPNKERSAVRFGSIVDSLESEKEMRIPVSLGKDVYGQPMLFDLATSPHLLVGAARRHQMR